MSDRASEALTDFDNPEWVVFGGNPAPEPGVAPEHGAFDPFRKLFARKLPEVKEDFSKVSGQIETLLAGVVARGGQFQVEEVTIELGFSASGRVVLVAEAGVEATISLTFRRNQEGPPNH
jgi:hypothetical protein